MRTATTLALLLSVPALTAPVHAQTLRSTPFPDGTGTVGLPAGWRIDGSYRGAVGCTGPEGAYVSLGLSFTIVRADGGIADLAGRSPVARAGDVGGALREVLTKTFGARLLSLRGQRQPDVAPGSPAYLLLFEYSLNGQTFTGLGYFATLDYGPGQPIWQLYSSAVYAPKARFAALAPTMRNIWRSWRPNGHAPLEGSASARLDRLLAGKAAHQEELHRQFRENL